MASVNDEGDIDDTLTSGIPNIDGLLTELHWSFSARVNFQFTIPDSETDYEDTRDLLIDDYPDDNHAFITAMPNFMVGAIRMAIGQYNTILNFEITENADNNTDTQLRYGLITNDTENDDPPPAYAYTPQDDGLFSEQANWMSGDMFYNTSDFGTANLINGAPYTSVVGTYQYHTILHETGHALGLKHGHEAGDGNAALPAAWDSMEFSVMTYRGYIGDVIAGGYEVRNGDYAQTLMMLDIRALQHIYGADFMTQSTNTVYRWDTQGRYFINNALQWNTDRNTIFLTIWDGGGIDTYDFSAFSTNETIDLTPGGWNNLGTQLAQLGSNLADPLQTARANVFNALLFNGDLRSIIENATGGTGNDTITGNVANNVLDGGSGNDTISGKEGDDILTGGAGADILDGGTGFNSALYNSAIGETITIRPIGPVPDGAWTVTGAAQAAGDTLLGIDAFRFGEGNDTITIQNTAATVNLTIDAAGGNDIIIGSSGQTDVETFIGGNGSDDIRPLRGVFFVFGGAAGPTPGSWIENLADNDLLVIDRTDLATGYTFIWSFNSPLGSFAGSDGSTARGIARIDYSGTDFVDQVNGGVRNDIIRSGAGNDLISGGSGNDILEGGDGNDNLSGGDGNDTIRGGAGADSLFGGNGDDRIETGTGDDGGVFGDEGNDTLIGNTGAELLRGGNGDDILRGGGGNDFLLGENGNDTLQGGDGNDTINTGLGVETVDGGAGINTLNIDRGTTTLGVTFFLNGAVGSDGSSAINITSMNYVAGSGIDRIVGSTGNDIISGGSGNDILEGGDGNDNLSGGDGNDTIRGGAGADSLFGGNGDDRIETGTGDDGGVFGDEGNDTLIGNTGAELLRGGNGDDILRGFAGSDFLLGEGGNDTLQGGDGNDTLNGGLGLDIFQFNTALNGTTNRDSISDFSVADDTFELDNAVFSGLLEGILKAAAFRIGAAAGDASDRIIYNDATGGLFFDSDGTGGASAQIQFASLAVGLLLTNADFVVI